MGKRRDTSSWLFVDDGMHDHPKIEALSDGAFRALVGLWCLCSKHLTDGFVTHQAWVKRTTPKIRKELIDGELVEIIPDENGEIPTGSRRNLGVNGVLMHDYLDWQRSAAEAEALSTSRASAGSLGNHRRWHVGAGRRSADCEWCTGDDQPDPVATGIANASQDRSQVRSQQRSQTGRKAVAERGEKRGSSVGREAHLPRANAPATPDARCRRHAALPPDAWIPPCGPCGAARRAAEADAEAERLGWPGTGPLRAVPS